MTALVIGVGNRDRGDDAAGPLVVDLVAGAVGDRSGVPPVETLVVEGDLSDLALRWGPGHRVVVVDAVVTGSEPGTVHRWDGVAPAASGPVSSHGVSLADALALGRMLDREAESIEVIGIEAASFGVLDPPTPAVLSAVEAVAAELIARYASRTDHGTFDPWPITIGEAHWSRRPREERR